MREFVNSSMVDTHRKKNVSPDRAFSILLCFALLLCILLASSKGSNNEEELSLDEKIDQLHEPLEATKYIKRYEEMFKN